MRNAARKKPTCSATRKAHWDDLNSPDAQAFMANFQQAFGGYPQHLDLDLLRPLSADGSIPSGKDVSLFVGRNGEVLTYARTPAPGGTGALRGIYGLDGGPNGAGSTGMNFFRDGTPQPASVLAHPATPSDPTGGIDVTLPNGAGEHWWYDPIDGFIRRQQDYAYVGGGYDYAFGTAWAFARRRCALSIAGKFSDIRRPFWKPDFT